MHLSTCSVALDDSAFQWCVFSLQFIVNFLNVSFGGNADIQTSIFGIFGGGKKFRFLLMNVKFLIPEKKAHGGRRKFHGAFQECPYKIASSADDFNEMENLDQLPCGTHDSGISGIKDTGQAPEKFSYIKSMEEQMSFAESRPHASLGVFCAKCKSFSSKLACSNFDELG